MLIVWLGLVLSAASCCLAAIPDKCCFDKQYTVTMGVVGETLFPNSSFFLDGVTYYGFDYYTDRQATYTIFKMPDGSNGTRYEMRDFAARRIYTRTNGGACTYKDMLPYQQNRPACIPQNATYIGPSTLGYGHQSMNLHTWSFPFYLDPNTPSQLILSVTQDHCVPVTESIIGVYEGIPLEESLFFVDYHPGVERLEKLEPPKNCTAAPASRRQ